MRARVRGRLSEAVRCLQRDFGTIRSRSAKRKPRLWRRKENAYEDTKWQRFREEFSISTGARPPARVEFPSSARFGLPIFPTKVGYHGSRLLGWLKVRLHGQP